MAQERIVLLTMTFKAVYAYENGKLSGTEEKGAGFDTLWHPTIIRQKGEK